MNPWILLFDSAIKFDRGAVLKEIRRYIKSNPEGTTAISLSKGYSRSSKMPDDELERRVASMLSNRSKYAASELFFINSLCSHFFGLAQDVAAWVYGSTFMPTHETRLELAWAYASLQSGWSPELIIHALSVGPPFPEGFLQKHSQLSSDLMLDTQKLFHSSLTNDAIKGWRQNFPFCPDEVFSSSEDSIEKSISASWSEVRQCVIERDAEGLSHALSRLAFSETEDRDVTFEAAADMVLLGIDLGDRETVSKGVQRIQTGVASRGVDKKRLVTVLMLGQAFLGHGWGESFRPTTLVEIGGLDPCFLGFAASLFCLSKRPDDASRFFFAAFKHRTSPLTWPLVALCKLDAVCRSEIQGILGSDEVPLFIDQIFGQRIIEALSSRMPSLDSGIPALMRMLAKQDLSHPPAGLGTGKTERDQEQQPEYDKPTRADWMKFVPALGDIIALYDDITEKESLLKQAQDKREYATMAGVASKLESSWSQVESELNTLIAPLRDHSHGAFDLPSLVEKKQLSLLKKVIESLDKAYSDKRKKDEEELETEIRVFKARLKRAGIERLWPKGKIEQADFDRIRQESGPQLARIEKLRGLRKGTLDAHKFESEFKDPAERELLIFEVIDDLTGREVPLNANLVDILGRHKWSEDGAVNVMTRFLAGVTKLSELGRIEQPFFVEILLPFIVEFAPRASVSPLTLILENAEVARLVTAVVTSDLSKGAKPLLQTISREMDSAFIENGDFALFPDASIRLLRELLIHLDVLETNVPISKKIQLLSLWVLRMLSADDHDTIKLSQELRVLEKLKDYLGQEGRLAEAVLLVAAVWRKLGTDRILDGFERVFMKVLLDLMNKGEEGRSLVKSLLQNPGWIIREPEGVVMFLYLCHIGDFEAIVDMARYNYFQEFKEAAKAYPVLVDEFFLKLRFGQDAVAKSEDPHAADYFVALQVLRDLDHDLQRPSVYRTWGPSSEYQKVFNHKLEALRERVLSCPNKMTNDLKEELEAVDSDEWIEEADKSLKAKAKYQAHPSMERYIGGQVDRLLSLLEIRRHIEASNMLSYLHSKKIPLRDRLRAESVTIEKESVVAAKVYQLVLGAME